MGRDETRRAHASSGPHDEDREGDRSRAVGRPETRFTCAECGEPDTVSFRTDSTRDLLCAQCQARRRVRQRVKKRNRRGGRSGGYAIRCSHCGRRDTVPFKPRRGGAVLCGRCMDDPRVVRVGGRVLHSIVCGSCGRHDQVPFKPRRGRSVLCGSCHHAEQSARKRARANFWTRHPRRVDGDEIRIETRCDGCGAEVSLSYAPHTHEPVLCERCVDRQFGRDWARRRRVGARVGRPRTCAHCGRTQFSNKDERRLGPGVAVICDACRGLLGLPGDDETRGPDGREDAGPDHVWLLPASEDTGDRDEP